MRAGPLLAAALAALGMFCAYAIGVMDGEINGIRWANCTYDAAKIGDCDRHHAFWTRI